ncbi:MAG: glycosyltransferase family 39 protein, partial [Candidatus Omnitrophota bacterium]
MNKRDALSLNPELVILVLGYCIFLMLTITNIQYPGLSYDETFVGMSSCNIIKYNPASKIQEIVEYCIVTPGGKFFPMMTLAYCGSIKAYLLAPFLLLFGVNAFSLRFPLICCAAGSIFFVYAVLKDWFGKKMALITFLFIVTNPVFIQYSRIGINREEVVQALFLWLIIFFSWKYYKSKQTRYLFPIFFVAGLALSDKLMFIWCLFGLITAGAIFWKKSLPLLATVLNLRPKFFIANIFLFLLGAASLITYVLIKPSLIIRILTSPIINSSETIKYFSYLQILKIRIDQLIETVKGAINNNLGLGFYPSRPDYYGFYFFVLSLIGVAGFLILSRKYLTDIKNKIIFIFALYAGIILAMPFVQSTEYNMGHVFIIWPFPQITMGLFVWMFLDKFNKNKIAVLGVYALFLAVIVINLKINIDYQDILKKTGGGIVRPTKTRPHCYPYSTATYDMVEYLSANMITSPFILEGVVEYRLRLSILFLSRNQINPVLIKLKSLSTDGLKGYFNGEPAYLILPSYDALT